MTTVNTYLYFNGDCEEAFKFYASVFRKELKYVGRYRDVPKDARHNFPNCQDEHIMHVSLPISNETVLMGADIIDENRKNEGDQYFSIYLSTESKEEANRVFNALTKRGTIKLAIAEQFWGSYYGICLDQFGINWKISFARE